MKNQMNLYVVMFVLAFALRVSSTFDTCGSHTEMTQVAHEYVEVDAPRAYHYYFQMCIDKTELKALKAGVEFTLFFFYEFDADNVSQPVAGRLNWTFSDNELELLSSSVDFLDEPSNDTYCGPNEPNSRYTCKANGTKSPDEIFHTFKALSDNFEIKYNLTTGSPCQIKKRWTCGLEQFRLGGIFALTQDSSSEGVDPSTIQLAAALAAGFVVIVVIISAFAIGVVYTVYKREKVKKFFKTALTRS
eukprot:TRINITY_DN3781_c0_g1_i1.p1 TRINITY_DN3781_c0_g1~~TRINITY_DN3781_c0_g1_i1.p1  ORF type:complete len:246 (+),score=31.06 TRINITY_DN3781_c0_g1_i1:102-839(+)